MQEAYDSVIVVDGRDAKVSKTDQNPCLQGTYKYLTVFKMFLRVLSYLTSWWWHEVSRGGILSAMHEDVKVERDPMAYPGAHTELWAENETPATLTAAPVLCVLPCCLTCAPACREDPVHLQSHFRLCEWATCPEFPKSYCIFNIAKRLNLRSKALYKPNIFEFLSYEVLKGWCIC